MNGYRQYGIHTQCNITQHKKEWNNALCSNIDGPGDFHTQWGKSEKNK